MNFRQHAALPCRTKHGCAIRMAMSGRSLSSWRTTFRKVLCAAQKVQSWSQSESEQMGSATHSNAAAEFVGTTFLLAGVVGSGIMGERLADGNTAVALLANSMATGAILLALVLTFGPVSGAHFNPLVSLVTALGGELDPGGLARCLIAQVAGAVVGVASANVMFGLSPLFLSQHARGGISQIFSEFVATFGLLTVVLLCGRYRPTAVAYAVAAYITSAYLFTFVNVF